MKKKILIVILLFMTFSIGGLAYLRFQKIKQFAELQKPEGKTYQCGDFFRLTLNANQKPGFFDKQFKVQGRVEILPSLNLIPPLPLNEGLIHVPFFSKSNEQKVQFQKISDTPQFKIPELNFVLNSSAERRIEIPKIILGETHHNHSEIINSYASLSNCGDLNNTLATIGFKQFQEYKLKEGNSSIAYPILNELKFELESKLANQKMEILSHISFKDSEFSDLNSLGVESKVKLRPFDYKFHYESQIDDVAKLKEKHANLWLEFTRLVSYFKESATTYALQTTTQPYANHLEKIRSIQKSFVDSFNQYKNIQSSSEMNWGGLEVSDFKNGTINEYFNLQNLSGKSGGNEGKDPFNSHYQIEKLSLGMAEAEKFEATQFYWMTTGRDARGSGYFSAVLNDYFQTISSALNNLPDLTKTQSAENQIVNSMLKIYGSFLPDAIEYKLGAEQIDYKGLNTKLELKKPSLVASLAEQGIAVKWSSVSNLSFSPFAQTHLLTAETQSANSKKIEIKNLENQISYQAEFPYSKLKTFLNLTPESQPIASSETKVSLKENSSITSKQIDEPCKKTKAKELEKCLSEVPALAVTPAAQKPSPFPSIFVERFKNYFAQDQLIHHLQISLKPENSFNLILEGKSEVPMTIFSEDPEGLILKTYQNYTQFNFKLEGRQQFLNFLQNIDPSLVAIVPMMISQLPGVEMNADNISVDLLFKDGKTIVNGKEMKLPNLE